MPGGWFAWGSPVIGDVNHDGSNDVVIGGQDGGVYAYDANGTRLWRGQATAAVASSPAIGDVDGDGRSELIFQGTHAGIEPPDADYRVLTAREPKPKPELEFQPDYIVNGQRYDAWEFVPDSFKVTGAGGTNVGIGVRW